MLSLNIELAEDGSVGKNMRNTSWLAARIADFRSLHLFYCDWFQYYLYLKVNHYERNSSQYNQGAGI